MQAVLYFFTTYYCLSLTAIICTAVSNPILTSVIEHFSFKFTSGAIVNFLPYIFMYSLVPLTF